MGTNQEDSGRELKIWIIVIKGVFFLNRFSNHGKWWHIVRICHRSLISGGPIARTPKYSQNKKAAILVRCCGYFTEFHCTTAVQDTTTQTLYLNPDVLQFSAPWVAKSATVQEDCSREIWHFTLGLSRGPGGQMPIHRNIRAYIAICRSILRWEYPFKVV